MVRPFLELKLPDPSETDDLFDHGRRPQSVFKADGDRSGARPDVGRGEHHSSEDVLDSSNGRRLVEINLQGLQPVAAPNGSHTRLGMKHRLTLHSNRRGS